MKSAAGMREDVRRAAEAVGVELPPDPDESPPPGDEDAPGAGTDDWSDPEPLQAAMAEAKPFPFDALGTSAAATVVALVNGTECAPALAATVVLSGIVAASHWRADVTTLSGKRATLSVAFFTVGRSGSRKTECEHWVFGSLRAAEADRRKQVRSDVLLYKENLSAWRKHQQGAEPVAPRAIRFIVGDFTPQGLRKYLLGGFPAILVLTSEGGRLTSGHAMKLENRRATLAALCDLLDRGELDGMRAGNEVGDDGFLDGRRMAMHVLIQPDAASEFLSDRVVIDQGFASRVLLAWPSRPDRTGRASFTVAEAETVKSFADSVEHSFSNVVDSGEGFSLVPIALSPGAAASLRTLAAEIEARMNPGGDLSHIEDLVNKSAEQATRIAGNLFVFEGGDVCHPLPASYADRGVRIVQWFVAEQERVAAARGADPVTATVRKVLAWIVKGALHEVRPRDLVGGKVAGLSRADDARQVLNRMVETGWAKLRPTATGVGRPSEVFDLHPQIELHFRESFTPQNPQNPQKGTEEGADGSSADSADYADSTKPGNRADEGFPEDPGEVEL